MTFFTTYFIAPFFVSTYPNSECPPVYTPARPERFAPAAKRRPGFNGPGRQPSERGIVHHRRAAPFGPIGRDYRRGHHERGPARGRFRTRAATPCSRGTDPPALPTLPVGALRLGVVSDPGKQLG
ncbi:MAG: hypothetical protein HY423_08235 [Candidatus Lambdaproteobacteria bacterium]|nr:hypothetical protein [Candidatus Lambdaproteobacteria bacterium]